MKPRLIALKDAALESGIPYRTLLERIEVGELPAIDNRKRDAKNGDAKRPSWFLEDGWLDRYLEGRRVNQRAQRAERVNLWPVPRTSSS